VRYSCDFLCTLLIQWRAARRRVIENAFSAHFSVQMLLSDSVDSGEGGGEGGGGREGRSQMRATSVVQPLEVRLSIEQLQHAFAVADTFSGMLKGTPTGSEHNKPLNRSQRQIQIDRARKKKAAFAREAMARKLHAGAPPTHTGDALDVESRETYETPSATQRTAKTTVEFVVKCARIATRLIMHSVGGEEVVGDGEEDARECALKLVLTCLEVAGHQNEEGESFMAGKLNDVELLLEHTADSLHKRTRDTVLVSQRESRSERRLYEVSTLTLSYSLTLSHPRIHTQSLSRTHPDTLPQRTHELTCKHTHKYPHSIALMHTHLPTHRRPRSSKRRFARSMLMLMASFANRYISHTYEYE